MRLPQTSGRVTSPDRAYCSLADTLPDELVFIMGCHRSGTSLLHHLLAASGQLSYLSFYDLVCYDELLANHLHGTTAARKDALRRQSAGVTDRGCDALPFTVDAPEEYRFLLAELRISLSLRRKKRVEFFVPHLTEQTLPRFLDICRKMRYLAGTPRPLLLKNPNDFYCHFMTVAAMLPQARFIFVHRHPLAILHSHLQSFRRLLEQKSAYWAMLDRGYRRLFGIETPRRLIALVAIRTDWYARFVAAELARSFSYYLTQMPHLPPERAFALRYEDLCQQPETELARLGEWLRLDIPVPLPANMIAPRHLAPTPLAQRNYTRMSAAFLPYLHAFGYSESLPCQGIDILA